MLVAHVALLNPPAGAAVVCVDEKTGMQALERAQPGRTALPGQLAREEFEYIRHGTRTLIASFDVRTGKVFGQVRRRTGVGLVQFMDALAEQYPTGDVYVVWDNLNIHFDGRDKRWTRFNQRHGGRFHFVYTPLHASWLNQIEMWFSILHRRVLKGASFTSGSELAGSVKPAESWDADALLERLHTEANLGHVRVRRRADLVTIESGPEADPVQHARMRRVAVGLWTLEMASHTGRWEKTPYRATRDAIVDTLIQDFGWTLEPID